MKMSPPTKDRQKRSVRARAKEHARENESAMRVGVGYRGTGERGPSHAVGQRERMHSMWCGAASLAT